MRLTNDKHAMLAGKTDLAWQWAIEHQMHVGRCLDTADSDRVSQAHIIADRGSSPTGPRLFDET